jgi:phage shock protein C
MGKRLYKDEHNKMIGGVCSGLAQYFDMDVTVVRLLFAFAFFIMGVGFIPYIVLWIVLPKKPFNPFVSPSDPLTVNYIVPPVNPVDAPFGAIPPKKANNGSLVVGVILILLGSIFLLHEFNMFYFWELHRFWPVLIVVIGLALIVKGQQKQPWEQTEWNKTTAKTDEHSAEENSTTNDNNPTV